MATNQEIARIFTEISEYLEMQNVQFKPRAYEKVAETIEAMTEEVSDIYQRDGFKGLTKISGVGEGIAEKIEELIKTGKSKYYNQLKKKTPVNLAELTAVEGLGPKRIKLLYQKLGIRNIKQLEVAAKKNKISKITGLGARMQEKILKSIAFVKTSGHRQILGFMLPSIKALEERLRDHSGADQITVCGSIRRRRETIGDIDILVTSRKPVEVIDYFIKMPEVAHVYAKGTTKALVRFRNGMDADLRVVPAESFGAALIYFTGSKDHNIAIRTLALSKGYTLNEYGLYRVKERLNGRRPSPGRSGERLRGKLVAAARTENEVYEKLGLQYIPPEIRENTGEVELALRQAQGKPGGLPKLIGYGSLKGDLQVQSSWGDGANSIEELAQAAMKRGLEYIAITDHTQSMKIARGLDEKRLRSQMKEIDALNEGFRGQGIGFRILKGTECDILKDGSLDLPNEILKELDIVGVSVHSHFKLPRAEQTTRVIKAMQNPHVDIFFHPTTRKIAAREAIDIDIAAIIKTAKETGTILEIDAFPDRSDLSSDNIRKAVEAGVKLCIDSDAHHIRHFEFLEYGISQARRGWATPDLIINTLPVERMLKLLK